MKGAKYLEDRGSKRGSKQANSYLRLEKRKSKRAKGRKSVNRGARSR